MLELVPKNIKSRENSYRIPSILALDQTLWASSLDDFSTPEPLPKAQEFTRLPHSEAFESGANF